VIWELGIPDEVSPGDVARALSKIGEKYLRLVRMKVAPLHKLLGEHGFEKGRLMIEKAYLRDKLLKMDLDGEGRRIPRLAGYLGGRPEHESAMVPGHGYVSLNTQELTSGHVVLIAEIFRGACNFAEHVGVDEELVRACRKEADEIESSLPTGEEDKE
jgi:hypothetical protein